MKPDERGEAASAIQNTNDQRDSITPDKTARI